MNMESCLEALLKHSVLVFNQRRWNRSSSCTTTARHFLGCARHSPFSWTTLFTIPPLKRLIKDSLCLSISQRTGFRLLFLPCGNF